MDPSSVLLRLQELATCPRTQPNSSSPFPLTLNFLRQLLIVSSRPCLGLTSGPLIPGFPRVTLHERLFSPICATFLHPSHSPSFDHPNNILWGSKTMKLPSTQFLLVCCYFFPHRLKYLNQHIKKDPRSKPS